MALTPAWPRLLWVVTRWPRPRAGVTGPVPSLGSGSGRGSHPLPSRVLPSPVAAAARPSVSRWPGSRARASVPGCPAMGCVGSRSPAGQGKRQRPGTGWGVGLRVRRLRVGGGLEEGAGVGREEPAPGRRARQEEGASWSREGAKPTGTRSCGLSASGLCRVDSCLSTCIPTTEGDMRRLAWGGANRPSPTRGDWPCPPTYTHPALPAPLLATLGVSLGWEPAFPSCVPAPLSLQTLTKYPTKEFLI